TAHEVTVHFVHVARGMRYDGRTLVLVDLSPSTIWLSPAREPGVGYLPTGDFLDLWRAPGPATASTRRRVRATLALLDADARVLGDVALLLGEPRVTVAGLAYDAQVVEGLPPASSGACVLFLEWISGPTGASGRISR
ncbi:MAG TPA: hypothetical protein PLP61_02235, partial [Nocardioides sp.]|uniref:hypothetical protein n=1 Tax=Nocardioides sp. TaxID=35761 RepID=UPI002B99357A